MRLPHHVHHRQVLDIGALADADVIDVAANDDVHPDRRFGANLHVADDLGALVDVCARINGGDVPLKVRIMQVFDS